MDPKQPAADSKDTAADSNEPDADASKRSEDPVDVPVRFEVKCASRGFHEYRRIWNPRHGEQLRGRG